jgi:hypothetical protein
MKGPPDSDEPEKERATTLTTTGVVSQHTEQIDMFSISIFQKIHGCFYSLPLSISAAFDLPDSSTSLKLPQVNTTVTFTADIIYSSNGKMFVKSRECFQFL